MLSDKINGLPVSRVDSPAISRIEPPPIGRAESKQISRVDLPQVSRVEPPPVNRIPSPQINSYDDQNGVSLVNRQGNILSFDNSRRNSGAIVDRDRSEKSIPLPAKPVTYTPSNTLEDVEKRRAELAALAQAVEA